MAKLLKLRRGTSAQHASFTGAEGEVTIDTTKDTAVVHDGSTQGGTPLAKEDMSNVSSASIAGRLGTDSISVDKIAGGTLPSDVKVNSNNIINQEIKNGDISNSADIANSKLADSGVTAGAYGSSSAIPIVTVNAKGVVTAASTTAIDSTKIQNGTTEVATASSGDITMKRSGTTRVVVGSAGAAVTGNLDVSDGIDVTGDANVTGTLKTTGNVLTVEGATPRLNLIDTNNNSDFEIGNTNGTLNITDSTNSANRLRVFSNGTVECGGNLDVGAGVDVTGNITVSGTVDGVDVALLNTNAGSFFANGSGQLVNGVTATTQTTSDDTTKVATTAFVRNALTAYNFPSGTLMLFAQTSAPTGWTKSTTHNNKALRVVSGTAGSGGSNAFTSAFAARGISANASNTTQGGNISVSVANATQGGNISVGNTTAGGNLSISSTSTGGNVNSHTLSTNEIPSHTHGFKFTSSRNQWRNSGEGLQTSYLNYTNQGRSGTGSGGSTRETGGSGGHSHGFSGSSHSHNGSLSGTAHNHNANFSGSAHSHNASGNFSGSAHNHSISVGNLDMAVQYVDVIIASKD